MPYHTCKRIYRYNLLYRQVGENLQICARLVVTGIYKVNAASYPPPCASKLSLNTAGLIRLEQRLNPRITYTPVVKSIRQIDTRKDPFRVTK